MSFTSIGDLARTFQFRRESAEVKSNLAKLTSEMTTGRRSNILEYVGGDFSYLASIERGIEKNQSYLNIIAEQRLEISTIQSVLTEIQGHAESVSSSMMGLPELSDLNLVKFAGKDAENRFASVIGGLNTQIGGRSIFSGQSTDMPALINSDSILSAIEAEVSASGASSPDAIEDVIESWFSDGTGYDLIAYTGSSQEITGVKISDTETTLSRPTALDSSVKNTLAGLSMAALLGRGLLNSNPEGALEFAERAGLKIRNAETGIVELRAQIGGVENQLDRTAIEVRTEADSLEGARSQILEADPFETAIKLQSAESQLQTIYTLTSRLADLSLARYL